MLSGIRISFYTEDEIRKLSVVRITSASTYDRGVPRIEGLNDPRLGVSHQTAKCPTCNQVNCDQHMGYIELARPVYRLATINYAIQVLRCVCRHCAKAKFTDHEASVFSSWSPKDKLRAISDLCRTRYICSACKSPQPTYVRKDRTFIETTYRAKDLASIVDPDHRAFVTSPFQPEEARAILEAIDESTKKCLNLVHPEEMVARLQLIPPPCIRPSNFVGESKVRSENDLTMALQDLLKASLDTELDTKQWNKLQVMQAGLVNHTIKKTVGLKLGVVPALVASNKRKVADLKTRLSGKKGRFRGNLSGKRVDQSGRSVVAPDSSQDIMQLGVPSTMMNTLTFPEPVNTINRDRLARAVIIGAYNNAGAMAVRQNETLIWLPILDRDARTDLAASLQPGWIVERHLVDGDWVVFNRQPSLWKASMMAFQCYRVPTLCFRLPLPVTKPFNADFDGDEMNIHSLQGYEALAEAQELLSVPQQIVNPQSNAVIVGLVQDSLVGGYRLTSRDTFLTRDRFLCLLGLRKYDPRGPVYSDMTTDEEAVSVPMPAILKSPKGAFYTGKQLVSALLPDISMTKTVRTEEDDDIIVIRRGQLLSGQLCKATLGATNAGIVQAIVRNYGNWAACKFLSDAQRVFVTYLSVSGPSISIVDCIVPRPDVTSYLNKAEEILQLDLPEEVIEAKSSSLLQETLRTVGGTVAKQLGTTTGLSTVVTSGSKGNLMNIAQIAGCVGQQTVFGRRIPTRSSVIGKRTLANFAPNDRSPASRGFISSSYLQGLSPSEFFYHQMAGREGIVATAVNTADSGYNQRRMIKSQESQCIAYDSTVRVGSKQIVQFSYGYDDLDGAKAFRFRIKESLLREALGVPGIVSLCARFLCCNIARKAKFLKELDFTVVSPISSDNFVQGPPLDLDICHSAFVKYHSGRQQDSVGTTLASSTAILVLYEAQLRGLTDSYDAILEKYANTLVQPGESVGALAATSIGEPSMQMTLNVFHYTGIASKNVTITGLPRFRQLINAVDTYETANMNAETSFETAPTHVHGILLRDIAKVAVRPRQTASSTLSFGAMNQKLLKRKAEVFPASYEVFVTLLWDPAERNKITNAHIALGLRKTLGSEACVVCPPTPEPLVVIPACSASNNTRAFVEAFSESLLDAVICGIPGVKRSLLLQETRYDDLLAKRSCFCIDTEGSSFVDFCKLPNIQIETATTNNVVEVCNTLGIHAASCVLQGELHKVLSFDSSYVDPRHTWLLSDTMCRTGSICAMNRHNMESLGNSLLQRASFEQSLEVFHEGAVFGRQDTLSGATERIMVGQPANVGTGIVHLVAEPTAKPAMTFVAPLHDIATAAEPILPLEAPKLLRVQDESRSTDLPDDIVNLFVRWRSYAGIQRQVAQVRVSKRLTKDEYAQLLTSLPHQVQDERTEVYHQDQLQDYVTYISKTFDKTHIKYETLEKRQYECSQSNTTWTLVAECPSASPPASTPLCVILSERTSVSRLGFVVALSEEYKGTNYIDAEQAVFSGAPEYSLRVSFETPESMLQTRATNAQLANAFWRRLV
jgi:DNA-directed RNA polymerase beta' subunit